MIKQWQKRFAALENTHTTLWKSIFRMLFNKVRDTRIQTLQFRLIHRIVPCDEWLFTLTVKPSSLRDFCTHSDSLIHFSMNAKRQKHSCSYDLPDG